MSRPRQPERSRADEAGESDLTDSPQKFTIHLKTHAVQLQEELARMVNGGFDMRERLDVTAQLQTVERKFQKLEEALHIKL